MDQNMKTFTPGSDTAHDLRRAFGRFGTGVTVVTVLSDDRPLGMTANSFSSVSLDPPLVLWSPAKSSLRHDAFAAASTFCIHVLAADQLMLAQHFAKQGHDFAGFDWIEGPDGVPTFRGCLATFHCTTYAVHPAGDHSLILGHVKHAAETPGTAKALLFNEGQFGQFKPDA
ncbi:flavin reductase [Sulfitobacter sp. TSTF-M16]|uniref:Flavin reductase n=2 Tax=Sulfitobacter aestuariivivens TaxID=2766981 RepID=A0A927D0Z0_9RHOB|nr:flavin reductase family protein [Sulfitobacter aestuariivivens]MBD3662421.1 flavin reductase [Sulfitobacter aestuariivivens]